MRVCVRDEVAWLLLAPDEVVVRVRVWVSVSVEVDWLAPAGDDEVCDPPVWLELDPVTGDPGVLPASDCVEVPDELPPVLNETRGENEKDCVEYGAGAVPSRPDEYGDVPGIERVPLEAVTFGP